MAGIDVVGAVIDMLFDGYDPKYVRLCNVEWFNDKFDPTCITVGELKKLSAKVVDAAEKAENAGNTCILFCDKKELKRKLADVIQACCNLAAAFGMFDLRDAIDECCEMNVERGCISKKLTPKQEEIMKELEDSGFTGKEEGV